MTAEDIYLAVTKGLPVTGEPSASAPDLVTKVTGQPELASEPDLLAVFEADIERTGLVGEGKLAKITMLTVTSRVFDPPVSLAVKGASSVGKSYTMKSVLAFFPPEAFWELSAMSERALAYSKVPLRHRMLVLFEAAGMAGDLQTYLLRSLLSEGRVRYETVEKTKNGLEAKVIDREGPTGLIVTTTEIHLHPENETRLFSVVANDTADQTKRVMRQLARGPGEVIDLDRWHDLQTWLANGDTRVEIPYSEALVEMVPPVALRLRRDFGAVLTLIRAHALLHRATRPVDDQGCVVATLEDYVAVRDLVADLVAEGVQATVAETVRETVNAVQVLTRVGATVSNTQVARHLGLDRSATSRRVRNAVSNGYLVNDEDRKGHAAKLRLGEPLPDNVEVLPSAEALEGVCSVARVSGGEYKNGPDQPESTDDGPSTYYPLEPDNNTAHPPLLVEGSADVSTRVDTSSPSPIDVMIARINREKEERDG